MTHLVLGHCLVDSQIKIKLGFKELVLRMTCFPLKRVEAVPHTCWSMIKGIIHLWMSALYPVQQMNVF